jgi:hypothetical protein
MEAAKEILVIDDDDDDDFQSMVSEVLSRKGFKVRCLVKGEANIVFAFCQKK